MLFDPACLIAFMATLALIRLLAPVAHNIGLVDLPRGHKTHHGAVPLVGGIAMFCGFLFAILAAPVSLAPLRPLFAGAALLVIIGVLDDFRELAPGSRLAAQVAAALLMTLWGGVGLTDLGHLAGPAPVVLGDWSVPFTVFSVVGVINALNLLDGMDGLAGGYALLAFLLLGTSAAAAGETASATVLFTLAAAAAAFLTTNLRLPGRPQALVFMGNSGSLFLGFALAWFVVQLSQGETRVIDPVTALWVLAVPLMDTVGILLRRLLHGRSPLRPDREHLHHLLCALGLGVDAALGAILGAGFLLAGLGYAAAATGVPETVRFAGFLGLFALYLTLTEMAWRRLSNRGHSSR